MPPEKRVVVAYHEAGHALVGWMLEHTERLLKSTIVPRDGDLGSTDFHESVQKVYGKEKIFDNMCMELGGCAAEFITFENISDGAQQDVRRVTKIFYDQIHVFAIPEKLQLAASFSEPNIRGNTSISKTSMKLIHVEVKKLVNQAYVRSKKVLRYNKKNLDRLAGRLLQEETLYFRDVLRILGPTPFSHEKVVETAEINVKVLEAKITRVKKMPPERVVVAYHEAGHALVSWMLEHTDKLLQTTIVPREGDLGSTHFDTSVRTVNGKEEIFDYMCMELGGCAAEFITFENISDGGQNDIRKVTKIFYDQILVFCIPEKLELAASFSEPNIRGNTSISKTSMKLIHVEVKKLVNQAYVRSKKVLRYNKKNLDRLAGRLLQKETLYFRDVLRVLGPTPFSHEKVVKTAEFKTNVKDLEAVASPETATTATTNGAPAVRPKPSTSTDV